MKQTTTDSSMQGLLMEVESRYDLAPIEMMTALSPSLSLVFRIVSEDKQSFLLKRHGLSKGLDDLLYEEKVVAALNAGNFDMAPLLVRTRGHHGHFCYQDHYWSLFEFIDSDAVFDWIQPTWSQTHSQSAGEALAALHSRGLDCLSHMGPGRDDPLSLLAIWLDDALRQARTQIEMCGPEKTALSMVLQDEPAIRHSLAETLQVVQALSQALPFVYVHGDYHPGNLLFRNSQVACIIDFEHMHRQPATYDLGYAALFFGSLWQPAIEDGCIEKRLVDSLVAGYNHNAQLISGSSDTVEISLKPFMTLACHLLICWALDKAFTRGDQLRPYFTAALRHGHRALKHLQSTTDSYTYTVATVG